MGEDGYTAKSRVSDYYSTLLVLQHSPDSAELKRTFAICPKLSKEPTLWTVTPHLQLDPVTHQEITAATFHQNSNVTNRILQSFLQFRGWAETEEILERTGLRDRRARA
jgi:hypothetical protein